MSFGVQQRAIAYNHNNKKKNLAKRETALASRQKRIGIQLSSGHHAERISNGMHIFFKIIFFKPPEIFFLFVILFQCKFCR